MKVHSVLIQNFKSIRELREFDLGDINVLIGANGSGKSNFITYFKFLKQVVEKNLQTYVAQKGGADNFLYFGRKQSKNLFLGILFENNGLFNRYHFGLLPTDDDKFYFEKENAEFSRDNKQSWYEGTLRKADFESYIADMRHGIASWVPHFLRACRIYHFHDTSDTALLKAPCHVEDNRELREDASNLAAFLFRLQQEYPAHFQRIEKAVRQVAPFFDRFNLFPNGLEQIRVEWRETGSDKYFNAHHLSDGTLRMICLATLFLQPDPPQMIIVDEPELGLHPSALNILSGLIRSASQQSQVLISTQSVTFINNFQPEDIIVVERSDGQSVFKRLDADHLEEWMEEYTMGEIWEKNLIGGRP